MPSICTNTRTREKEREQLVSSQFLILILCTLTPLWVFLFLSDLKTSKKREKKDFDCRNIHERFRVTYSFLPMFSFPKCGQKIKITHTCQFFTSTGYSCEVCSQRPVKTKVNTSERILTLTSAKHLFHYVHLRAAEWSAPCFRDGPN